MHKHIKKTRIARAISNKFDNELHFIKTWAGSPKTTGSIVPTGTKLAQAMASLVRPDSQLPVLELGPGTGAITKAILARGIEADSLYALEFSKQFLNKLHEDFPGVNFIHGDAFNLDASLCGEKMFDTVISALPLLNFPQQARIKLIESLLDRIPPGRPIVQFSYGMIPPVRAIGGRFDVEHHDWIIRNMPPARVWLYKRQG